LANGLINDAAAVGASGIGNNFLGDTLLDGEGGVLHVTSHALLGCAAASLKGSDCASGAIGGAVSAALLPRVGDALGLTDADKGNVNVQAGLTALSMLAGSVFAHALGKDAVAAAVSAQNEALNNYLTPKEKADLAQAAQACRSSGDANSLACIEQRTLLGLDAQRDTRLAEGDYTTDQIRDWQGQDYMAAAACPPPRNCGGYLGDAAKLEAYWRAKATGEQALLPGTGPEDLVLGAMGLYGLGRWGVSALRAGALEVGPLVAATEGATAMGSVADANFAQSTIRSSEIFSKDGIANYSQLAGRPINTVDDLAVAIQSGAIKPSQLPIDYVVTTDGTKLILNTRTSVALDRAGIPKSDWYGTNKTGVSVPDMISKTFDDLAADQLKNNKLPSTGTPTMPKGKK
jgi:filamentous hemagglutinin